MATTGTPVLPDAGRSTVKLSKNQCPVGDDVVIHLTLVGSRGNPMIGPGVMNSVDAILTTPSGQTRRVAFPSVIPPGGICAAKATLSSIGVHELSVKVCGHDIRGSPVKVLTTVRGKLLKTHKPPMNQPHDVLQHENVFVVTDKSNNQVQVFDREFRPANKFCAPVYDDGGKFDPYAVAWTGETFVVTDLQNHCVVEFKNFVPFRIFGRETLGKPTGIAAGRNKRLYVADCSNHCIFVFDEQRECVSIIGGQGSALGQMNDPWFMAMNSREQLVVGEHKNQRMQVFDPTNGNPIRIIEAKHGGKKWDVRGLALDPGDNIYITVRSGLMRGWSTETVLVYSPMGDFLGNFGEKFNYVRGLTVSQEGQKTTAYVVDGANHSIVAYEM